MIVPSSNLLNLAFSAVAKQPFEYLQDGGRTLNSVGLYDTTFLPPKTLYGSIQAVSRNVYQERGLDFQKQYISIYVSQDVFDMARDVTGDQVIWNGHRYQLTSETAWYGIDGWLSVIAVQIDTGSLP